MNERGREENTDQTATGNSLVDAGEEVALGKVGENDAEARVTLVCNGVRAPAHDQVHGGRMQLSDLLHKVAKETPGGNLQ